MRKCIFLLVTILAFCACSRKQAVWYYAPSEVTLQTPVFDIEKGTVELHAVYNGADDGIASASFSLLDPEGQSPSLITSSFADGKAVAKYGPLKIGVVYTYNFNLKTIGGNEYSSADIGRFDYSYPHDFSFGTATTSTSKVLTVFYEGLDEFVSGTLLQMVMSDETPVLDPPAVNAAVGQAKALFHLDEWAQDLYTCKFIFNTVDGQSVESGNVRFNLLPVPENVTLNPVEVADGKWNLSASYDGEDRTVDKAVFVIKDAEGSIVADPEALCAKKTATASVTAPDYGRYTICCTLYLIDETSISTGDVPFKYSKPRAFETLTVTQEDCKAAGCLTSDVEGPQDFTVNGYSYQTSWLRYKTSSSGPAYLVNGSSRKGYLLNNTEFQYGIKSLRLNLTQNDRLPENYFCSGKHDTSDEWTIVTCTQPDAKIFEYDLSAVDNCYFKWESKGVKELRIASFEIDYFTEPAEED